MGQKKIICESNLAGGHGFEERFATIKELMLRMRCKLKHSLNKNRGERYIYPNLRVVLRPRYPSLRLKRYRADIPLETQTFELGAIKHWANLSKTRFYNKIAEVLVKIPRETLLTSQSISFEAYRGLLDHRHPVEEQDDPAVLEHEGLELRKYDDDSIEEPEFLPKYVKRKKTEERGQKEDVQQVKIKNINVKNLKQTKIEDYFKPRQQKTT